MAGKVKKEIQGPPMLFPFDPDEYWEEIRKIIREEVTHVLSSQEQSLQVKVNGLTEKPLFKMKEVCALFKVTRPTVYEWIRIGKLKPYKIRSRVYFLQHNIKELLGGHSIGE